MENDIKKNIMYNFAYQVLVVILPLITTPYISRTLGPTKLGEYSYAYAIAYYFVMFVLLGINNYGNRTVAMIRDDERKLSITFTSIYLMQLIMGVISLIMYVIYCYLFSNNIMSWLMILYVLSAILDVNWFFFGMELFKLTVTRNALIKIVTTIPIFLFVKNKNDIYIYALIMVSGILISQLALWPFIRRYVSFKRVKIKEIIKHFKPNFILFIPIIAVSLYKVMDKIMLGSLASKTEVGLYESSERIIQIPMALIQSLGTVMLPKMTNLFVQKEEHSSKKYFYNSIILVMILSSSMCFGIMGVARYFVPLYYGDGYLKCIKLFQILLPSCLFLAFANVVRTQYLIPRQKDKIYITSVILGAVINLAINFVLIPKYASIGAAIGTLAAEALVCFYQSFMIRKEVSIWRYACEVTIYVIPAIIMYSLIVNIEYPFSLFANLFLLIITGVFIYFICFGMVLILKRMVLKQCRRR